jgi:hypothetical protein
MREKKSGKLMLLKKADLLLFFAVIILGAGFFMIYRMSLDDGKRVKVSVDGEVVYEGSLNEAHTEEITCPGGRNVLVIEQGEARISEADCPDKICVKKGEIYRDGETIVCLPNHLYVVCVSDIKKETDN